MYSMLPVPVQPLLIPLNYVLPYVLPYFYFFLSEIVEHTQCNEDTCMHGGICIEQVGGFKCKCDNGYKGQRCEGTDLFILLNRYMKRKCDQ